MYNIIYVNINLINKSYVRNKFILLSKEGASLEGEGITSPHRHTHIHT